MQFVATQMLRPKSAVITANTLRSQVVPHRPTTARTGKQRSRRAMRISEQVTNEEIGYQQNTVHAYKKTYDKLRHNYDELKLQEKHLVDTLQNQRQMQASGTSRNRHANILAGQERQHVEKKVLALEASIKEANVYKKTLCHIQHRVHHQSVLIETNITLWQKRYTSYAKEQVTLSTKYRILQNEVVVLERSVQHARHEKKLEVKVLKVEIETVRIQSEEHLRLVSERKRDDIRRRKIISDLKNPRTKTFKNQFRRQMEIIGLTGKLKVRRDQMEIYQVQYDTLIQQTGEMDLSVLITRIQNRPEEIRNLKTLRSEASLQRANLEKQCGNLNAIRNEMQIAAQAAAQRRERDALEESVVSARIVTQDIQSTFIEIQQRLQCTLC